jgi:hypothetical protein
MKRHLSVFGKVGLALLVLLLAAGALSAQTKIRTKDANAVIRIEPADKGEIVQDKLAVGTVFAVERKAGDWYEIKYRSAIGVLLSGFIHKSQVEEIKGDMAAPKAEPAPVKTEIAREERSEAPGGLRTGLEIGLSGGMGFSSFTSGSGSLSNTLAPYDFLQTATETGTLGFTLKNPVDLAASFAYFFTPTIGVRLQIDLPLKQTFQSGTLDYNLSWKWTISSSTYNHSTTWPVTGDFSVIPISLNAIVRFPIGATMDAYITAGPSYFMGKINAASSMGVGLTWWTSYYNQRIDYFQVPLTINKSVNGIGFNAGAGLDIRFGESFGVFLEGAYFMGPSSTQDWLVAPGSYPSMIAAGYTLALTQDVIDNAHLSTRMSPLEVKLSFMKLAAGIKIAL